MDLTALEREMDEAHEDRTLEAVRRIKAPVPDSSSQGKAWTPDSKAAAWKAFDREATAYEPLFKRAVVKFLRDTSKDIIDRLEKHGVKIKSNIGAMNLNGRQKWLADHKARLDEFLPSTADMKKRLEKEMKPAYLAVLKERGDRKMKELDTLSSGTAKGRKDIDADVELEFDLNDPEVLDWLGVKLEKLGTEVTTTTVDNIKEILRDDFEAGEPLMKMGEHLRDYFTGAETYRANLIARTESTASMNEADLESVRQMDMEDVVAKVWLAEQDDATRDTHREAGERYSDGRDSEDGQPMRIDDEFEVGDDRMTAPGGGTLAAENCNCRCGLVYEVIAESEEKALKDRGNWGHAGRPGRRGGSGEGGGDHPALKRQTISEAKTAVMYLTKGNTKGIEYAALVDKDGKPVGSIKGTKDEVRIPKETAENLSYIAHNHVADVSLSGADVGVLTSHPNMLQIDAIAKNGETVYSLYKPEGWRTAAKTDKDSAAQAWELSTAITRGDRYLKGGDPNEIWTGHSHEAMKVVANHFGLVYVKKERGMIVKGADASMFKVIDFTPAADDVVLDDSDIIEKLMGKSVKEYSALPALRAPEICALITDAGIGLDRAIYNLDSTVLQEIYQSVLASFVPNRDRIPVNLIMLVSDGDKDMKRKFFARYARRNKTIKLNRKYFEDPDTFRQTLADEANAGFHPAGCTTIKSVMDHEFGHALSESLNDDAIRATAKQIGTKRIIDEISEYATKSTGELCAEAWTQKLNGTESAAAKMVNGLHESEMIAARPACFGCANFVCAFDNWHCKAFPDGDIPEDILYNGNPHTSPVEGDHGILFTAGEPTYE